MDGGWGETAPVRRSSVLILFGEGPNGPDLLLVQRAPWLRTHAGQAAFPGGGADPADAGPIETALREAREETGVDPAGVAVLGAFADLWLPISANAVTPVVAWWHAPSDVFVADDTEITAVVRIPLHEFADPAARGVVTSLRGASPAFEVGGLVVWGFTGVVISALLQWLGLERPWDPARELRLPPGEDGPLTLTVGE